MVYPIPPTNALSQNDSLKKLAVALYEAHHGHVEDARQAFAEAMNLAPESIPIQMHYATFLARQKNWSAAKRILACAVQQNGEQVAQWLLKEQERTPDDLGLVYLRALQNAAQSEKYLEARAAWEQLLRAYPNEGEILFNYAALLEAQEDWDAAERHYQLASETDVHDAERLIAYGAFLEKRGREKEALSILSEALRIRPDDLVLAERVRALEAHSYRSEHAQGKALLARHKLGRDEEEAARLVAEAMELDPCCALAYAVRAKILERQGFLTLAESNMARAVEIEPNNSEFQEELQDFRNRIALLRQQAHDLVSQARQTTDRESARVFLVQALNLIRDDADILVAYAQLHLPDQPYEAEKYLQTALMAVPGHYEANREYALLLRQQNRVEAEQHFRVALQAQLNDEPLLTEYVDWLIELSRYKDAEALLQYAADHMPLTPHLQTQQAVLWAKSGRLDQALEKLSELVQSDSHDAVLQREFAVALCQKRQYTLVEEHFQTALELNPRDGLAHHEYALFLQERQRIQQAQEHIRAALALLPNDERISADAVTIEQGLIRFDQLKPDLAYAWFLENENAPFDQIRLYFQSAREKDHSNVTVLKEYAAFLLKYKRDVKQAEEMVQQALDIVPEEPALQSLLTAIRAVIPPPLATTPAEQTPPSPQPPPPPVQATSRRQSWWKRLFGIN